jgi:hypothetical protein
MTETTGLDSDKTVVKQPDSVDLTPNHEITVEQLIKEKLGNRFKLFGRIGIGGMGQVFKAKDQELDRIVAIKAIHPNLIKEKWISERLRNEAKIVAKLKHSNIVQIYDFIEISGHYLMVLEFIEGHDFKMITDQGLLSREQMLEKFIDICDAIQYAHVQGIIHRDLKPHNIMLTSDGQVKIMDFGISSIVESGKESETLTDSSPEGSPMFMAPELFQNFNSSITSDIYALGVTLFYTQTSRPPFSLISQEDLISNIVNTGVPAPSTLQNQLSKEVDGICLKACALNPADRYQSALEMGQDLRRFIHRLPVSTVHYPLLESVRRSISFRPMVSLFSFFGIALLFIAVYLGSNHVHRIAEKSLLATLHDKVGNTAYSVSLTLNHDNIFRLIESPDFNRKLYLAVDRPIATLQKYNTEIRDAYLLQPINQGNDFKVVYARHGSGNLNFDKIIKGHDTWSANPVVESEHAKSMMRQTLINKVVIQEELDADSTHSRYWQKRMLGYSPVYGADGKAFAILVLEIGSGGIALTFEQIEDAFRFALGFTVFVTLLLLLAVIGTLVLLWKNQSPPQ